MTTRSFAGVGRSINRDGATAGREAAREAMGALEGRAPSIVLVFATAGHDQEALVRGVREATKGAPLVGCSAEGIVTRHGSEEVTHAATVAVIASDEMWFETFSVPGFVDDPAGAARALSSMIATRGRDDGALLALFPDGIGGDCRELLETLEATLPAPLRIVGGTAGDLLRFERTWQYEGDRVLHGGLSALLIGGAVEPEVLVTHGCDLVGSQRVVTQAQGGWMERIDDRPAWSFFQEYLADGTDTLEAMHVAHLLVAEKVGGDEVGIDDFTVRVPVRLDATRGALYFQAGLRAGTRVQLAVRNPEKVCARAVAAAREIAARRGAKPLLVLDLECAGRGALLFGHETTPRLIAPVQREFDDRVPWVGAHTYGEIAPVAGRTWFHNYTAVLCALYPRTR
ncbi:FIST signal transduction protein [Sandaracinus amylolyticus]|uniref:FIST signal transduction protein n=1 Tax=Sandaracinus amylolyticus TaxID=927083 RepID=UPI001F2003FF|nr:FIST N-terminal domain-containing protein [Sandaracinus amylolyticus]